MPKRISIATHLNIELEQVYRQAKDGRKSPVSDYMVTAQGKKKTEEEVTGYSRTWIYALVKR